MRWVLIVLLSGCGTSVNHETRSLLCLGFCSEQRVEHNTKESPNETDRKAPRHPGAGNVGSAD